MFGSTPTEIDAGEELHALAFSAKGDCLVSGALDGVRVWREGKYSPTTKLEVCGVICVAVSNDGRLVAAGTVHGYVHAWDMTTGDEVHSRKLRPYYPHSVDFSPDSKRLLTGSNDDTAAIWGVETSKKIQTFHHSRSVIAAKYSSEGDRIATATYLGPVRIWDSNGGRLLIEIAVTVVPWLNAGLLWSNGHIFVVSDNAIKKLDPSTGSTLSKCQVPDTNNESCIALPKHGELIAYATKDTVTFLDTAVHTQIGQVRHPQAIRSVAISPDDKSIAIAGYFGKIRIKTLPRMTGSTREEAPQRERHPLSSHVDFTTRQRLCEDFFSAGRIADAVETFRQLTNDLGDENCLQREDREWTTEFRLRCSSKVRQLGDTAADAKQYNEAIAQYSSALWLESPSTQDVLIKRSKAYLGAGSWKQALDDANGVITLDRSSPLGYEAKHAALHKAGDYENAVAAIEEMLSRLEQSPDLETQRLADRYIRPSSTRATIRKLVQRIIPHLPRELINTANGRMYNRADLESEFLSSTVCHELVSSMTTRVDYVRIKLEVRQYFRYVMLSHRWEDGEPLYQDVVHTSVYELDPSITHDKLQTYCKVVRDGGFIWAWSDTCCINKSDNFVLQEALVAMFKWYEGSALTVVYLRGVTSLSQLGALMKSIWNTRAWTLQEYVAAKIVLFYTEDWTLYFNIQLRNHKESQQVISEMEQATGVSAEELMALRPGLGSVRDKLRLASTRKTTLVEDEAYSLLGIFLASGIPAIYGEREGALGRLLSNVLSRSGDISILAWTGDSGPFNSCLPAHVSVYNGPVTSHLPARISDTETDTIVVATNTSPFDVESALQLYDHLRNLPIPRFSESRMTILCIMFQLPKLSLHHTSGQLRFYRTNTKPFGRVDIKTKHDLSRGTLYLVHPWLRSLLEDKDVQSDAFETTDDEEIDPELDIDEAIDEETMNPEMVEGVIDDGEMDVLSPLSEAQSPPPSPVVFSPIDRETQARRIVTRLRQPFGALLFRVKMLDQGVVAYERVAADSMIRIQFREDLPLSQVLGRVRTVDVL